MIAVGRTSADPLVRATPSRRQCTTGACELEKAGGAGALASLPGIYSLICARTALVSTSLKCHRIAPDIRPPQPGHQRQTIQAHASHARWRLFVRTITRGIITAASNAMPRV